MPQNPSPDTVAEIEAHVEAVVIDPPSSGSYLAVVVKPPKFSFIGKRGQGSWGLAVSDAGVLKVAALGNRSSDAIKKLGIVSSTFYKKYRPEAAVEGFTEKELFSITKDNAEALGLG